MRYNVTLFMCACAQVKELLAPYGALKSFNLVMDKNTGKSKVRVVMMKAGGV